MHGLMPNPLSCPVIAATATASDPVKEAIRRSLHFRSNYHLENLGNFRANLRYGVHTMRGGQKSYHEVCDLFPLTNTSFRDQEQAIIFVEDYVTAHSVVSALRKHFGLSGKAASDLIPCYHSLQGDLAKLRTERRFKAGEARILVCTEALTMVSLCLV
jgi:superfamily II DNA helicase RecQ